MHHDMRATCSQCAHWELPRSHTQFGYCEIHDDATYKHHYCRRFTSLHEPLPCAPPSAWVIRG
ncbi:MAG: hypothetical protein AB7E47_12190 [Desulfovibrionaceae bacterium]